MGTRRETDEHAMHGDNNVDWGTARRLVLDQLRSAMWTG